MSEVKAVCGGFIVGEGLEMNGKVLSATGGGEGGGDFVITMSQNGDEYELDKTYEEIKEAFNEHKTVKLLYEDGLYIGSRPTNNSQSFVFGSDYLEDVGTKTTRQFYSIVVQYDGSVVVKSKQTYLTDIVQLRNYSSQNKYIFLSPWNHSRVYEFYSKGFILAFESSDGEVFTLEHCDADKTILSNKHLNDDGTVSLRMLTATGTTTSSTTMVTKTIS